jgi:hypothetical protein
MLIIFHYISRGAYQANTGQEKNKAQHQAGYHYFHIVCAAAMADKIIPTYYQRYDTQYSQYHANHSFFHTLSLGMQSTYGDQYKHYTIISKSYIVHAL